MAMKPWMHRKDDEDLKTHHSRVARSCCWCGQEDESFSASVAHEDRCNSKPGNGAR